jgi:hypothetical protein
MFKNSGCIFVEKIHKMGCLEGGGVPILHIRCTIPKGQVGQGLHFILRLQTHVAHS